jgi:hypothetical protein
MSVELTLLRCFCEDRKAEETHGGYVKTVKNMEREIKLLFNLIHEYYQEFEQDSISYDELLDFYTLKYPKARDVEMHTDLMIQMFNRKYNPEIAKRMLDQLLEKHEATKIVNKLLPVMEGEKYGIVDKIPADVDTYIELLSNPPDHLAIPEPINVSVEDLVTREILDEGYPWHLDIVTNTIGGLRRKTLGLIYAYVDAGKTSFAMASCAHFAHMLEHEELICYMGNEEPGERLQLRLLSSVCQWTRSQVRDDWQGAEKKAKGLGYEKVKIFEGVTSGEQVEKILKEYKPVIAYVDQSTDVEVRTGRKREGVDYLKALFKWYRTLSTIHNVGIIGVAQGTGDAENTKYLKLSDVMGSRSAIQGSLDWALGIGKRLNTPTSDEQRFINMPKNKLLDGDKDKFSVMFNHYQNIWRVI